MDPDETLRKIRQAISEYGQVGSEDAAIAAADDVANLFAALDDWLVNGGFKPHAWSRAY